MELYDRSAFPSQFAPKAIKDKKSYGLEVCQAILGATSQWREKFRSILKENRKYAEGKQDIKSYLKEMDIDEKNMFTNISFKPRPIAQSFMRSVVQGYNLKNEYPNVTSLSKYILDRKQEKKDNAKFRMNNKEVIAQLSQEVGFPVEDPNEFTPNDTEELDLYFQLNDKEREELMMQEMVNFALEDNNIRQLKNDTLYEQFQAQFHGYYDYIDQNGRWCVDFIQAEDIITDNSFREDFKDASYKGRFLRMNIVDVRNRFNIAPEDEEKLFKYAQGCAGKYGNGTKTYQWNEDYRYSAVRPYDNFTIELAHIWIKTAKVLRVVEGKDRYGRTVFDTDYKQTDTNVRSEGRKSVSYKYPITAYEGYFTADAGICLEWGEQRNILRQGEDKEELLSPFIFNMPENRGAMLPNSLTNMMIDSIRAMDLDIIKIKQVIAKAAPDGYNIDVDSLMGVDLGNGIEKPMTIMDIKRQTGDLYYRGKDEAGNPTQVPVSDNISQFESKIVAFMNNYNFELGNIRAYLGVNEFRDGSATSARIGFKFLQAQSQASNTITWFLYQSYINSAEELMRHAGIRIWDALMYGNVNEGYAKYLGKKNIEWLRSKKEITASSYDMKFAFGISEDDQITLEKYIDTCLANGSLKITDALMINRVKDPVIAERMLTYLFKKREKEAQELQLQSQEANRDMQTQVAVATEEAKQASIAAQLQADAEKNRTKGEQERDLAMEQAAYKFMEISITNGITLPPEYQAIIQGVIQNRGLNITTQTEEKEQQILQYQQEQEQQQLSQELEQFQMQLQKEVQDGSITPEEAQVELENAMTELQGQPQEMA